MNSNKDQNNEETIDEEKINPEEIKINEKLIEIEDKILKYEQFMEQWLVNNSCCDTLHKKATFVCSFFS